MPDIPINIDPVSMADARPDPAAVTAGRAIGDAELKAAQDRLERYKEGKANYDARIIENEDWWKFLHWENFKHNPRSVENKRQNFGAKPVSGWLFNSIMMKHADAMDNYPEASVLPRESADEQTAKLLSEVMTIRMRKRQSHQP